jgi:type IV pilus assembly protein PilQ
VIDAGGQGAQGGGGQGGAQGQPNAAAFFPRAAVSKEEAGIKLTVTPQITNNRMVLLDIQAENSSAELANTDVGVVFNRQRADSKVLVADGEAAVIGELTVTETTRFRSGIGAHELAVHRPPLLAEHEERDEARPADPGHSTHPRRRHHAASGPLID